MAALGRTQLSPPSQIRRRSRLPPLWHLLCQQWNCPQSLLLRQQMLRTSSRPPPGSLTPWLASPSRFDSTKDGLLRVRVPCSAIMMMRCAVHASHASTTMPCVTVQRQALPRLAMRTLLSIPFCASSIGATPARVGCCDLDFRRDPNGLEYAQNAWCNCLEGAFARPMEGVRRLERCRFYSGNSNGTEWPFVPVETRARLCDFTSMHCDCCTPGTYVPMCPYRLNAATGERRGDEVANMRGHSMWQSGERFGSPALPSLPASPSWERSRHG